ncbi:MAG: hypothetical protein NTX91_02465 [candidate division SR1 bacterium]|nr:hypothetical protein [candidate division SR1 bacterium]
MPEVNSTPKFIAEVVAICFVTGIAPELFLKGLSEVKTTLNPKILIHNLPIGSACPEVKKLHEIMDSVFKGSTTTINSFGFVFDSKKTAGTPKTKEMAHQLSHKSSRIVYIGNCSCAEKTIYSSEVKDYPKKVVNIV